MKVKNITAVLFLAASGLFAAPPKVAVLDAILPDGMDPNIGYGVTEKISEELVVSGKYTVLDRTTVGQSLKEIEFQMSGLVSEEEIKKAGEQLNTRLGASYVVIARVTHMGNVFFISVKLIDVRTGQIATQASAQASGGEEVNLQIAEAAGKKLAAGAAETAQLAGPAAFRSHLTVNYTLTPLVLLDSGLGTLLNFNIHCLISFGGPYICVVAEDIGVASYYSAPKVLFEALAGGGWGFSLGQRLQLYLGGLVGYGLVPVDIYITGGPSIGAELGLDWIPFGDFVLGGRVFAVCSFNSGELVPPTGGVSLGAGFAY